MARQPCLSSALPQGRPGLRWWPFVVLALAGALLGLLWPQLPARWAIHWGLHGQPDGWATKTLLGVFLPIGFGVLLCGFIEGVTMFILAYPQMGKERRVTPEAAHAMAILTADFTRLVSLGLAIVCALLALGLPLWRPTRSGLMVLGTLAILLGAILLGLWWTWRGVRLLKARGLFADLEGWNGLIYRHPQDPRIWVPKIAGIGYTLNFAHRKAWLWLGAFLILPLLVVLTVIVLSLKEF